MKTQYNEKELHTQIIQKKKKERVNPKKQPTEKGHYIKKKKKTTKM